MLKLDVPALERDMPKYQRNMPEDSFYSWRQWFERVKCATNPNDYIWAVDTLRLAARCEALPIAEQLPDELLQLRERENQPTREVSNTKLIYHTNCKCPKCL